MSAPHPNLAKLLDSSASALPERIQEHLRTCPACQRAYQVMVEAERQLAHGHADAPSRPEYDRILSTVLSQSAPPMVRSRRLIWLGLPMAAALAGAIALFILPQQQPFQQRGAALSDEDGVRAICHAQGVASFATREGLSCPAGGTLVVAVRLTTRERATAHVWLEEGSGRLRLPTDAPPNGEPVRRSPEEQVLSTSIDLGRDIAPGAATLVVALCDGCPLAQARAADGRSGAISVHRLTIKIEGGGP